MTDTVQPTPWNTPQEPDAASERLVRLAAKLGDLDAYDRVLAELRDEKRETEEWLNRPAPIQLSKERLKRLATEFVLDLHGQFDADPEGIRDAFRGLLRDNWKRVGPL